MIQRNINDDITMAYLLQTQKKSSIDESVEAAVEAAKEYTQDYTQELVQEAIDEFATAIAKTLHDAVEVTLPGLSPSRRTFTVDGITEDHELVQQGYVYLTNPAAATGDLTLVTSEGEITVTGSLNGSTDLIATFCVKEQKTSGT